MFIQLTIIHVLLSVDCLFDSSNLLCSTLSISKNIGCGPIHQHRGELSFRRITFFVLFMQDSAFARALTDLAVSRCTLTLACTFCAGALGYQPYLRYFLVQLMKKSILGLLPSGPRIFSSVRNISDGSEATLMTFPYWYHAHSTSRAQLYIQNSADQARSGQTYQLV